MDVILLATAWGPRFGGINSFNQDFALGIVRQLAGSGRVFCAVPNATQSDLIVAQSADVTIIPIPDKPAVDRFDPSWAFDVIEFLRSRRIDLSQTIWIGHDLLSGDAAINGARITGGRCALIMHMSYIQYQAVKHGSGKAADAKHRQQKKLFSTSDVTCFAVGPLLSKACKQAGAQRVHQLVPGFPANVRQCSSDEDIAAITFGRLDKQSDIIKQGRLAVAGFGRAIDLANTQHGLTDSFRTARLSVVGLNELEQDARDVQQLARKFARRTVNLITLPYDESREELFERLRESNLAMMLSWHEGFGLTGWEAIAAEIPLIVSKASGVYQLIEKELSGAGIGCLHPVEIRASQLLDDEDEFAEQDVKVVASAILDIAANLKRAKRDAQDLKTLLVAKLGCTWDLTAKKFLDSLSHQSPQALPAQAEASSRTSGPPSNDIGAPDITRISVENSVSQCVELIPGTTQGSSATSFDLLPELRFGEVELDVGSVTFSIGLREALLTVGLTDCKLAPGARLGDTPHEHIRVDGNRWRIVGPSENGVLVRRALGTEPLAKVRARKGSRPIVDMHVSAQQSWISYRRSDGGAKSISRNKQAILEMFVNKCLGVTDGTIILSRATMGFPGASDETDQ